VRANVSIAAWVGLDDPGFDSGLLQRHGSHGACHSGADDQYLHP
jgi:hypothetical protein